MLLVLMLTLGLHLLVSLVMAASPSLPARGEALHAVSGSSVAGSDSGALLASTYEEAASDPADSGECAPNLEVPLSLPTPGAILDCNDARVSVLLADMIGTCDMPRKSGPQLLPTVHTGSSAPQLRISDGLHNHGRSPLRSRPRPNDAPSLLPTRVPLVPSLAVSRLAAADSPLPQGTAGPRLERPPRA
jgi:hypothetical protein